MIPYHEALSIILRSAPVLDSESVQLSQLIGRSLAEPLTTPFDIPHFDSSAMDGYAVWLDDVAHASEESPVELPVSGNVHAGALPESELTGGHAQRVMTGAPIPRGCEAVIIREETIEATDRVIIRQPAKPNQNVRRRGEEFRKGDVVLPAGTRLNPAAVALVASLGLTRAEVCRLPRVSLLTTGDEVIDPGSPLRPGQLYNSNRWGLYAALLELGIEPVKVKHVSDSLAATRAALEEVMSASDVVISTGGVSMGDSDHVKDALAALNADVSFDWVAVKPGKPMCFATYHRSNRESPGLLFGCPGNPVSSMLSFHFFIRPALRHLQGDPDVQPLTFAATLSRDLKKKPGRHEHVRGIVRAEDDQLFVEPTHGQYSHMLGGLALANCIIHFPSDLQRLSEGDRVQIELVHQPA